MKIPITDNALTDLRNFGSCLIHTKDLDPIYPIMKQWLKENNAELEEQLWFEFIYMYWYSLPSAFLIFKRWRSYSEAYNDSKFEIFMLREGCKYPIGTERRHFRGNIWKYLNIGMKYLGDIRLVDWVCSEFGENKYLNRKKIENKFKSIPYWGNWSGFKVCDLLQLVSDLPLKCSDMSLKGRVQYDAFLNILDVDNRPDIEKMDNWGHELEGKLKKFIPDLTQDILETIICKHHSMCSGYYSVGYDIYQLRNYTKKTIEKYPAVVSLESTIKKVLPSVYWNSHLPDCQSYKRGVIDCRVCGGCKRVWFDKQQFVINKFKRCKLPFECYGKENI